MDATSQFERGIVSIPLRPGVVVRVAILPHDLTKAEARKIAAVVKAYASPETPKQG